MRAVVDPMPPVAVDGDGAGFRYIQNFAFPSVEAYELSVPPDAAGKPEQQAREFAVPVEPLLTKMGSKSQLLPQLVKWFPRDARTYVEIFGGVFRVVLGKGYTHKVEIVNDIDGDFVHMMRYARDYPDELAAHINHLTVHEGLVYGLRAMLGRRELKGIERAAAYYIANTTSFNGSGTGYSSNPGFFHFPRVEARKLRAVAARLRDVDLRCRDFRDLIPMLNKPVEGGVFFYLDPPYDETAGYITFQSASRFGWKEQEQLAQLCVEIDAMGNRWLQTNSATPRLRALYGGLRRADGTPFVRQQIKDVKYTIAASQEDRVLTQELITSNFDLPKDVKHDLFGRVIVDNKLKRSR